MIRNRFASVFLLGHNAPQACAHFKIDFVNQVIEASPKHNPMLQLKHKQSTYSCRASLNRFSSGWHKMTGFMVKGCGDGFPTHNPEVVGSNPTPATKVNRSPWGYGFLMGLRVTGYEKSLLP